MARLKDIDQTDYVTEWREFDARTPPEEDFRAFLLILRRALYMIIRWIEERYKLTRE